MRDLFTRFVLASAMALTCVAAPPDPAASPDYAALTRAYEALKIKNYDGAIAAFLDAVKAAPGHTATRKDLAYTYLKIGEADAARDQFGEAMKINPADFHVALEFAFLCFESKDDAITYKATARRIFNRIRESGDTVSRATAEQAFQNIDEPLRTGIARWTQALATNDSLSAHEELASLGEQRDELELAAEHYLKAWHLLPARKSLLLDLGRVRKNLNQLEEANAALLAASRGGEPRVAERARELLPERYPFVYEFRRALALDPQNAELHRELAYLLMRMGEKGEARTQEAEDEFRAITETNPDDLLSAAQLGFLYLSRKDTIRAMPLLQRVLAGSDEELASHVRTALHMPAKVYANALHTTGESGTEARVMAEKSLKAGYLKDALKYLKLAHDADPVDFSVMLKMAWAYNMLREDGVAMRWFALARKSPDSAISEEAEKAWETLRPSQARVRTTAWMFPFYSSRWKDVFSYGQIKTEFRIDRLPFRPYLSTRFVGDLRRTTPGAYAGALPQNLSESSFILAFGVASSKPWHGITEWAEAGSAIGYLSHHMLPDYRGGASWARSRGKGIGSETPGFFYETTADGVFVSRFNNDFLAYSQNRAGWTLAPIQLVWNANITTDAKHQYWANFVETGPGIRFHMAAMPPSLLFSFSVMRGVYLINTGNPRRPNFNDFRAGLWYALTR